MGNTCKPMAVSFQCMTTLKSTTIKSTTIKERKKERKKHGDRVMEKKKRMALLLCQAKGEHSRLFPQEPVPPPW